MTALDWGEVSNWTRVEEPLDCIVVRQAMFEDGLQAVRLEEPPSEAPSGESVRFIEAVVDTKRLGKELKTGERVSVTGSIEEEILVVESVSKEVTMELELSKEEKEEYREMQKKFF